MEATTTIRKMMAGNSITVPIYSRAYTWDTPPGECNRKTQTDLFLSDLENYSKRYSSSRYYFGHFLFEEQKDVLEVIDGQQRLTTIVIFLSALFSRLKKIRQLTEEEEMCFEDIIQRKSAVRFSTKEYDNQFFRDYVINQKIVECNNLERESSRRIYMAFNFFREALAEKQEDYLVSMLEIVCNATCTTYTVHNESEARWLFLSQNGRGLANA